MLVSTQPTALPPLGEDTVQVAYLDALQLDP